MTLRPLLPLLLAALPALAQAQDDRHFMFTGEGVAEGEGRFGIEGNAVIAGSGDSFGAIPSLGLRYARGLAGPLDLRLSLVSLLVYDAVEAGIGVRLVQAGGFGLGARVAANGLFIISSDGGGGVVAGVPGLVASMRGENAALSLGFDLPMYFNGFVVTPSQASSGAGFILALRPNVALELGSHLGAKFYVRGDATIFIVEGSVAVLANAGLGVHF